ncbi:MAG: signal recognition particle-docking protein FtsY [Myxococcales bacterium]|nr:signal recognition particle-docking protein FtsY [Myxococcales bacterium]
MADEFQTLLVQHAIAQAGGGGAAPAEGAAPAAGETAAPTAAAPAEPWVEYGLYGAVALAFLILLIKALRKPTPPPDARSDDVDLPTLTDTRTEAEVAAAAREAFAVPEVLGGGAGRPQVRMKDPGAAPAPTGEAPPKKAPAKQEPAKKAPATVEKPAQAAPEAKAPAAPKRPAEEAAGKTLREGLARTNEGFVKKLGKLFGGARTIDDDLLGDLEEALFTADIGVRTSQKLVDGVHQALGKRELSDPKKVWQAMKGQITEMLQVDAQPLDLEQAKPFVVMVVGVNGAGKTTSIGKLANRYRAEGKKVLLAAGDTFRAAAVEQLEVWGKRAEVPVVRGKDGQDPSSVIFEAVKRATDEGYDVVIADTAGRLQAKKELMDELGKVHRVIGKAMPGAPHEVWLVLDATNGQNAISQAKEFTQVVEVTGLVLTKLDGTAKGGVVIGICDEMRLPVRYIGIGEKVEDLRPFQADAFAEALFAGA